MRRAGALLVITVIAASMCAQNAGRAARARTQREQERAIRQEEARSLGIGTIRNGVTPSKTGEKLVNYDERKGGPVSPLPDPLRFDDGRRVRSVKDWKKRRLVIMEHFDRELLGRVPKDVPAVRWRIVSTAHGEADFIDLHGKRRSIAYVTKHLAGEVNNRSYPALHVSLDMELTVPEQRAGKIPVELHMTFYAPKGYTGAPAPHAPSAMEQVLARGWAFAVLYPTSFQKDSATGLREGIIGLVDHGGPRKPDDWGVLRAWAWGASRAMDYLETDPDVDATRVGIDGHSRYGKTALIAMAYDQRFRVAQVSSSGIGGAALWRRTFGEELENIAAANEFHWMAENFLKYAADPLHASDLPVDAHELFALCAPRFVFVGVGVSPMDGWADPKGEFLAMAAANPVYRLFGLRGVADAHGEVNRMPPQGIALMGGRLAFRQHAWGHTQLPNWPAYLDFAQRAFDQQSVVR
ncbi:MAG: acetylxylan esterase [Acidobacteria bacterium]|nr:acetylxylan esterase [Acidobacteriota bacterium]